ncbi:MAG: LytTR family DNA-binding domain-containing protein [Eubacteriales bacterium]|nr:LytTR family DNA-binding domain-containing protein [Eubacteriales bacterium]
MYKIVACDDMKESLFFIRNVVEQNYFGQATVTLSTDAFSTIDYICETAKGNVDILMIDIDLGNDNGIEVAELIKQKYPHIKIIFFTGHIDYARDIFEADPCFFIVKPMTEERVIQAIDKAISLIQVERQFCISIVSKGEIRNLQLSRIRFVENRNRTLIIREQNLDCEVHMKLSELQKQLPDNFIRCHQSYIVNLSHIRELTLNGAELYSGEVIPVSRSKYSDTKKAFLEYLQATV